MRIALTTRPSPWPSDDAGWAGVRIVTGGIEGAHPRQHWIDQGVPPEDADALLEAVSRGIGRNEIITVESLFMLDHMKIEYALTGRAVADVEREFSGCHPPNEESE